MQSVTSDSFGPLVAYLVPGATVLVGLRPWIPALDFWFHSATSESPTIGGFLFLTVAALAAGMTVSGIRWAVLDPIHAWTGIGMPKFDFSKLGDKVEAMKLLIEIHYKHYLFYGNSFIALGLSWMAYRTASGWETVGTILDVCVFVLLVVFFTTSRDTLKKYYDRLSRLFVEAR